MEIEHLKHQKQELCAQIRDLTVPLSIGTDSVPELKKQLRELESRDKECAQELASMTAKCQQQEQVALLLQLNPQQKYTQTYVLSLSLVLSLIYLKSGNGIFFFPNHPSTMKNCCSY